MMIDDPATCPDPEVLAAFLEGELDAETSETVRRHLLTCDECLYIIRGTKEFKRESGISEPAIDRNRFRFIAIAASLVIAIVATLAVITSRRSDPIRRMNAAMRSEGFRPFEGRLAAIDYERFQTLRSAAPANLALTIPAQAALENTASPRSAREWYTHGVAQLVLGDGARAVKAMTAAAQLDSKYRADLSAARIALGTERDDAAELQRALEDANTALRSDPSSPIALFNRALALERLGDTARAADAYAAYVAHDPSSPWAAEARWRASHLGR